jgi:CheY-like chemotaxis protein
MRPGDCVVRMVDVMAAPAVSLHPADRSCAKAEYDFNLDPNATISITPSAKQVLIVEDDPSIADVLEDVLHENGYGVTVAHTGVEALSALRIGHTDLVLLDLMLPDMNGWRFLQVRERLRADEIPVLVTSAAGREGIAQAQELGAPVFLAKPFQIERLLVEVGRLCAGLVRQCAWCNQVMDDTGEFRLRCGRNLPWATHGICQTCEETAFRNC